jgi:hypothetical protein
MRKFSRQLLVMALLATAAPLSAQAGVAIGVSINIAPPVLPVYEQPPMPGVGYIWTPGYWAWGDDGYYWVPGTWVLAPAPGLLWTPGYWGWAGGVYLWHVGYWGPHVGFYGGVNYGFGYGGVGFEGGYWRGGAFYYNHAVTNFGAVHVTNVYNRTVINNVTVNRVSFNGGTGGLQARPNPGELRAERDHHVPGTLLQTQHQREAMSRPELRAAVNHGRPAIAATARPGAFSGRSVVAAREAGGPMRPEPRNDRPPGAHQGGAGPEHTFESRGLPNDRPNEMRNDRPPQSGGYPQGHNDQRGQSNGYPQGHNNLQGQNNGNPQAHNNLQGQNNDRRMPMPIQGGGRPAPQAQHGGPEHGGGGEHGGRGARPPEERGGEHNR